MVVVQIRRFTVVRCIVSIVGIVNSTKFLLRIDDTVPPRTSVRSSLNRVDLPAIIILNSGREYSRSGGVDLTKFQGELIFTVSDDTARIRNDPRFDGEIALPFR